MMLPLTNFHRVKAALVIAFNPLLSCTSEVSAGGAALIPTFVSDSPKEI